MKVSMIIVCLALVPFVVAQAPPAAEAEEEGLNVWGYIASFFERDPVITMKEKAQSMLDSFQDSQAKVNDFLSSWELPTIPVDIPTIEELDQQRRELTDEIERRVQDAIDSIDFSPFDEEPAPEGESEPEPNPEVEPEPEPVRGYRKWRLW